MFSKKEELVKQMKTIIKKPIFDIFSKPSKNLQIKKEIPKIRIIADYREKNSLVPANLEKLGIEIEFKELKVGDFIVKDTAIERKTVSDFISSMINKRLTRQLEELQQYKNRLLIIEGIEEQELYTDENIQEKRGMHPNAIRGFLLSILLKYKVPIIYTKNAEDTAKFIGVLSRKVEKEVSLNVTKRNLNKNEQLQFIIESFPGIGPKKSKELLKKFKTIKELTNASLDELKEMLGKKAELFFEIINRNYK